MWRSKKFVVIGLLAIVVLAGSIGGVALAQSGEGEDDSPQVRHEAMLDRVCEIYNEANPDATIDPDALKDAFAQAGEEQLAEAKAKMAEAREAFRQKLIDEGKVTQEQLDEFDAWIESRPDVTIPFGFEGRDSMPRLGGFGGPGGGHHRGGESCLPDTTE